MSRRESNVSKAFVNVQVVLHTLSFSRKILASYSDLILGHQKPPLFFFILTVKETPNIASIGVLFNRFWAQQLICWICPKFVASTGGKSCRIEMSKGSEWTLEHCFVDSNIGRNYFACWKQDIMFAMPQRQELKNAHKSRIMNRVWTVQIPGSFTKLFKFKSMRADSWLSGMAVSGKVFHEAGTPLPLGRDSHWTLAGRTVTVFTLL